MRLENAGVRGGVKNGKDQLFFVWRDGCQNLRMVGLQKVVSLFEEAGDLHPHIEILNRPPLLVVEGIAE